MIINNKKCLCIVSKIVNIDIIEYYKRFNFELFLLSPTLPNVKIEGVNYILDSDVLSFNDYNFNNTDRPNWYYQQLLKFAVVMMLPYEYVHIIDGDSYLEEEAINSFDTLYFSNKKINETYCNFNKQFNLSDIRKNFIVNHMVFHKETMTELYDRVFISWNNILNKINIEAWLSEYYSYANYAISIGRVVDVKQVKVFRRGDLLPKSCLSTLGKKYQLIAFENQHSTSLIKRIYVNILYFFKLNLG